MVERGHSGSRVASASDFQMEFLPRSDRKNHFFCIFYAALPAEIIDLHNSFPSIFFFGQFSVARLTFKNKNKKQKNKKQKNKK